MMQESAQSKWSKYKQESVISKSERFAKYTRPSLMVDPTMSDADDPTVESDYQSVGSTFLNTLTSKLIQALFPVGIPFFTNKLTPEIQQAGAEAGLDDSALRAALAEVDREATDQLFANAAIAKLTKVVMLLIVTGQCLVYRDRDLQTFRVWNLHSFVCRRDPTGRWREIILKERFQYRDLPENLMQGVALARNNLQDRTTYVDVYTHIERQVVRGRDFVTVKYEVDGRTVANGGQYPEHLCPWVLPVWELGDGEQYARGYVEQFSGDFAKLSSLSEDSTLYAMECLQLINLIDAGSGVSPTELENKGTGDFVEAGAGSIAGYERGDYHKIEAIEAVIATIVQRLAVAFMYSANQRDAERVTAEEVRAVAREVENTLGGVYSLLAESLQRPLAFLCMSEVSEGVLAGLLQDWYEPDISTGMAALGRNVELQTIQQAFATAAQLVPAIVQVDNRVDPQKLIDLIYQALGVDRAKFSKSAEQLLEEARAQEVAMSTANNIAEAGAPNVG